MANSKSPQSVRHSVTVPVPVAREVRRVAQERHITVSRALAVLVEKGLQAEAASEKNLTECYDRFMAETDPVREEEAGKQMIRAIFGENAIAEDSI
ncbi:MAG: hypothetical protein JST65_13025 [Acidobacteria bacterium]|nr:hypothetical protein [Acidobacteriota bacterium]